MGIGLPKSSGDTLTRRGFVRAVGAGALLVGTGARNPQNDTRLRVMEWNIRNTRLSGVDPSFTGGAENQRQTLHFLRRERPDVLFVVETYGSGPAILEGLNRALPRDERYTAVQVTKGTKEQEEAPDKDNLWIFSRYPVVREYPTINEDRLSSFNFGGVRIELPSGLPVDIFDTWLWHAGWAWGHTDDTVLDLKYGLPRRRTDEEIIATDLTRRQEMATVILNERLPEFLGDSDAPVILAGDFNTFSHLDWSEKFADAPGHQGLVLDWPVLKLFEEAGFRDTFREAHPDAGTYPGRTWSPYFGFGYAPGRIDYILTRGDAVRVAGSHTYTRRLPRHRGVYFDDQFPFYSDHGSVTTDLVIVGGGQRPWSNQPGAGKDEVPFTITWADPKGTEVPHTEITPSASHYQTYVPERATDDDITTMWHAGRTASNALPQSITLDLGKSRHVTSMTYQGGVRTRQNGNVTNYRLYLSQDGEHFTKLTEGEWEPNLWEKDLPINREARYLRFEVTWGFGGFAAASEIRVYEDTARR